MDYQRLCSLRRSLTLGKRIPKAVKSEKELDDLRTKDLEELLRLRLTIKSVISERFEKETTILLADMVGFTKRTMIDNIESAEAVQKLSDILGKNVRTYNGFGANTEGDSFIATFDKPELAALAALESIEELKLLNKGIKEESQIHVHISVCSGKALFKDQKPFVGNAVNIAARILKEAEPDMLVTTEETYSQISAHRTFEFKELGSKNLKGIDKPVAIYEIKMKADSEG